MGRLHPLPHSPEIIPPILRPLDHLPPDPGDIHDPRALPPHPLQRLAPRPPRGAVLGPHQPFLHPPAQLVRVDELAPLVRAPRHDAQGPGRLRDHLVDEERGQGARDGRPDQPPSGAEQAERMCQEGQGGLDVLEDLEEGDYVEGVPVPVPAPALALALALVVGGGVCFVSVLRLRLRRVGQCFHRGVLVPETPAAHVCVQRRVRAGVLPRDPDQRRRGVDSQDGGRVGGCERAIPSSSSSFSSSFSFFRRRRRRRRQGQRNRPRQGLGEDAPAAADVEVVQSFLHLFPLLLRLGGDG